jgi:hypothetical protein
VLRRRSSVSSIPQHGVEPARVHHFVDEPPDNRLLRDLTGHGDVRSLRVCSRGPPIRAVAAGNGASWRALERAGFHRVAEGELTPDNAADPPDHVVYRLTRPASG